LAGLVLNDATQNRKVASTYNQPLLWLNSNISYGNIFCIIALASGRGIFDPIIWHSYLFGCTLFYLEICSRIAFLSRIPDQVRPSRFKIFLLGFFSLFLIIDFLLVLLSVDLIRDKMQSDLGISYSLSWFSLEQY